MTISISSAFSKLEFKKAPKPQASELDEVGKFLTQRNVFSNKPQEAVRNAKASAAFFNAQGFMTRGTEDQAVKVVSKGSKIKNFFGNLKNKAANIKADPASAFGTAGIKEKAGKNLHNAVDSTKSFFSKPVVKKGLKYAGIAALALGVLYLGKKAYDYYKDHKATPVATGSVDVKDGDNVWNIAKKDLGSKATNAEIAKRTEELMKLNNLEYANDKGLVIIKPGDKIKLS